MIPVIVGNEHRVDILVPDRVDRDIAATEMEHAAAQDWIGQQANAIDFNQQSGVSNIGKNGRSVQLEPARVLAILLAVVFFRQNPFKILVLFL